MKEYKIINIGFPSTKMSVKKKIIEWEETCNSMSSQGWTLKETINQGIVCAFIFEREK